MEPALDPFDSLCRQVYLANDDDTSKQPTPIPSNEETALSLISRAQVYELPTSYTLPSSAQAPGNRDQDRRCYRIHLETIEDPILEQTVRDIIKGAIDPSVLMELPFDRNLSGYSSKTRTETRESPLEAPVVLDMEGVSATIPASDNDKKTMFLIPTQEWLRMSTRIRFWRAESHRIKAAEREIVLDGLLNDRWKDATSTLSSAAVSSPPPSSGSLVAADIPPKSLPSSPNSSSASSPATSPRSSAAPHRLQTSLSRPSLYRQPFQEHQLNTLVQFISTYGDEPSATSILRGLLNLIRRQITEPKVLSWTFERANLTEQRPVVTVAFLDLVAKLGLELVIVDEGRDKGGLMGLAPDSNKLGSITSLTSESTVAVSPEAGTAAVSKESQSTELTWTFGPKVDDRRLEYWIHNIQQSTLPVLKMDDQSLLPSTATFTNNSTLPTSSKSNQDHKQNPIPAAIRKRFLQDRNTIPAGSIQVLTTNIHASAPTSSETLRTPTESTLHTAAGKVDIIRDRSYVLASSKYALSDTAGSSASSSGVFVDRVRSDVKHLVRWATTCGGRLDWIWTWLFSSFQKSRYGSAAGASERRPPRSNDENV
ncbi:hypothetical protein BC939DRAFT_464970 [Gamsiella multidivaricata]|uniref:uncharacterized protein n=1 Tax=Gamsiella multidivaricata TaxID=101098 RepID=UPI002220D454|nr:uncharacterized protein BC939DRAFT_464970 [Gamsiella multidivaricata]KAG0355673.1 hypothetical protein BGZ54_001054 [Gamsiella multidivaricata]KAI7817775.1 hypothetical protein BC939DRAFT_464970 [Gamsiella multidivaricata]